MSGKEAKAAAPAKRSGETSDKQEKSTTIRQQNMAAVKGLSDVLRTSLGPKGMDKMIQNGKGEVLITNDGATILKNLSVLHPTAKILVETSKAQDIEAGDGTTSVVVMAGSMMSQCERLLEMGIHPTAISDGFAVALKKSLEVLNSIATPIDIKDTEQLVQCVTTSLASKVVSQNSLSLAPLAVQSVLKVCDPEKDRNVDLNNIKVVKKMGGTIDDIELCEGILFADNKPSHSAGGPTSVQNAKIALLQFCLSAPKTDIDSNIVVQDYSKIDKVLKQERTYIINLIKKIVDSGANVLLIQKSVLRDAVNDLALHFLAKKKIMVVKDIERTDVDFICNTVGCIPVAHIDQLKADKLGKAERVEEVSLSDGAKVLKIAGTSTEAKTLSILVRGSNMLVLHEAERSLHDALCVVRSLVKNRSIIPGGGAPEIEIAQRLEEYSQEIGGINGIVVEYFARALEVIPYTLAENCGLNPVKIVTEIRARHKAGEKNCGLNGKSGIVVENTIAESIMQPTLVTESAFTLATEVVRMILKIDDIVMSR